MTNEFALNSSVIGEFNSGPGRTDGAAGSQIKFGMTAVICAIFPSTTKSPSLQPVRVVPAQQPRELQMHSFTPGGFIVGSAFKAAHGVAFTFG